MKEEDTIKGEQKQKLAELKEVGGVGSGLGGLGRDWQKEVEEKQKTEEEERQGLVNTEEEEQRESVDGGQNTFSLQSGLSLGVGTEVFHETELLAKATIRKRELGDVKGDEEREAQAQKVARKRG